LISAPRRLASRVARVGINMGITSAYIKELNKLGIDWGQLRDDHVSGMSKYDIAQAAYLFLLENPEKSASYAVTAVIADARRRAAMECEMPDGIAEEAAAEECAGTAHREVSAELAAAADLLRDGTAAAASALKISRRRVQQLLAREPRALAQRLAAAAAQRDLFMEGV